MSDPDDTHGIALAMAIVVAGMVIAGVLAIALSSRGALQQTGALALVIEDGLGPVERIDFEPGSAALPPDANEALERAATAVLADGGLSILVLPMLAADGDATAAGLALARVQAVRHALQANGVPAQRILLAMPEPTTSAAERVELRLQ